MRTAQGMHHAGEFSNRLSGGATAAWLVRACFLGGQGHVSILRLDAINSAAYGPEGRLTLLILLSDAG